MNIAFNIKKVLPQEVVPQMNNRMDMSPEKVISFQDIQKNIEAILASKNASPAGILKVQLLCHQYQVQVEMVSKCAEAASTTLKKLQQGG